MTLLLIDKYRWDISTCAYDLYISTCAYRRGGLMCGVKRYFSSHISIVSPVSGCHSVSNPFFMIFIRVGLPDIFLTLRLWTSVLPRPHYYRYCWTHSAVFPIQPLQIFRSIYWKSVPAPLNLISRRTFWNHNNLTFNVCNKKDLEKLQMYTLAQLYHNFQSSPNGHIWQFFKTYFMII